MPLSPTSAAANIHLRGLSAWEQQPGVAFVDGLIPFQGSTHSGLSVKVAFNVCRAASASVAGVATDSQRAYVTRGQCDTYR
jgi:hypothetical protein